LPPTIFDLVKALHLAMGADPAAIAMAALAAVAGAVHAETKVQMAVNWLVRVIVWLALVGRPSTMKSPVIDKVISPLVEIDRRQRRAWETACSQWKRAYAIDKKTAGPRPPKPPRCIVHDGTPEKVTELTARSSAGVTMLNDELGGWIGSFENYGGSSRYARALYLKSWDGGYHTRDRIGKGHQDEDAETAVDNLAIGIVGGIQPDVLAAAGDLTGDGLIQRFNVVLMQGAERGDEEHPTTAEETEFAKLINSVHSASPTTLQFADDAVSVRKRVLDKLTALEKLDGLTDAFTGAVGKLKSYFGRWAGVLHIANEHSASVRSIFEFEQRPKVDVADATDVATFVDQTADEASQNGGALPFTNVISRDTAEKVERLLFGFLLPHTYALYDMLVGGGKDRDTVRSVADFILTSKKERLVTSDFTHGVWPLRSQPNKIPDWAARFVAYGWLVPGDDKPVTKSWLVATGLREHYAERQRKAAKARAIANAILRAGGTRPKQPAPSTPEVRP
jgi:Protein of unknown function (DUF3987)